MICSHNICSNKITDLRELVKKLTRIICSHVNAVCPLRQVSFFCENKMLSTRFLKTMSLNLIISLSGQGQYSILDIRNQHSSKQSPQLFILVLFCLTTG